ncbi:MAG: bifunctional 5,10-methylenetetrahydrofolate dehydrogenase/5,10-methenyltetrahydrofolate cyclohydrolase, partial [Candidatus Omnitrophota bacterium]|nr:bifunctional 5,10-methylenetetrahydrofolate dehydrogenase/5,10-methenyltetrahydrofolate cyclohydrolase [Candidatus Omnitrophota bacterium]
MAKLLEGKPVAEKIKAEIKLKVQALKIPPVLASILAQDNAGAQAYAASQAKTAEALGITYQLHKLAAGISQAALIELIGKLNSTATVNGIIIQMPLPQQIDYKQISAFIAPEKDVEGVHPSNIGKIVFGRANLLPCTAAAVMELLKETAVDLYGKEVVVVGHSEIVGKPLALLLLEKF